MMCSASSLASSRSSRAKAASEAASAPRGRVPLIGETSTTRPCGRGAHLQEALGRYRRDGAIGRDEQRAHARLGAIKQRGERVPWLEQGAAREPTREVEDVDVAGCDALARLLNCRAILAAAEARSDVAQKRLGGRWLAGEGRLRGGRVSHRRVRCAARICARTRPAKRGRRAPRAGQARRPRIARRLRCPRSPEAPQPLQCGLRTRLRVLRQLARSRPTRRRGPPSASSPWPSNQPSSVAGASRSSGAPSSAVLRMARKAASKWLMAG